MTLPLSMTFMSLDMDRPLNKAHWHERKAETLLKNEKWDDAEASYHQAAELMRKALNEVSSTSIAEPLQMQVDQLEKMKGIIDIKRKEASSSRYANNQGHSLKQPFHGSKDGVDSVTEEPSTETKRRANSTDKGTETSHIEGQRKTTRQNSQPFTWQLVQMNDDLDRPKDSLLPQFLRRDVEESRIDSRKVPMSQEAQLEEYRTRLSLMQEMMQGLMKQLQAKEEENEVLKEEVQSLRSEVVTLNDRLEVYEGNQNFRALHFDDKEKIQQNLTGDMTASMLITQPESYFEFDGKDLETELDEALLENRQDEKCRRAAPPCGQGFHNYHGPTEDQSVQYQDLDDGINTEVSQALSNSPAESNSAGSSLGLASLAGLPPLSPVPFEVDDKDNIFANNSIRSS